jgi:Mg2+ and Co2+ transporter CorA
MDCTVDEASEKYRILEKEIQSNTELINDLNKQLEKVKKKVLNNKQMKKNLLQQIILYKKNQACWRRR